MIGIIATTLATILIPTASLNGTLPENYSAYAEQTAYVQQVNEPIGTGIVYTPNGTAVDVEYHNEGISGDLLDYYLYYFICDDEHSGIYKNTEDIDVTLSSTNFDVVYGGTTKFNAAAFAFYMYWENKNYNQTACVMKSFEGYINDKSYIKCNEPRVNDIVLYYSIDGLISAGVVTGVDESEANDPTDNRAFVRQLSKCRVLSMWWEFGLYEHRGDLCPFVGKYAIKSTVYDTKTVRVEYYRRHETHNFVAVKGSENGSEHTGKCDGCGYEKHVDHYYTYTDKTSTHHTANCDCGIKRTEEHTWTPVSNIGATRPGMVVRCISCSFLKRLNPDEFVPVIRPLKMPFDIKSLIK